MIDGGVQSKQVVLVHVMCITEINNAMLFSHSV